MSEFIYKSTALEILGITDNAFKKLGIVHKKEVRNPNGGKYPSKLYDRAEIESLVGSELVEKLKPKKKQKRDLSYYAPIFKKKYTAESAIKEACNALFNLNRYCKHQSCSSENKEEIYRLKNEFIKFLYDKGFCRACYVHTENKILPAKECFSCFGIGCERCDDTGFYLQEEHITNYYFVFEFEVFEQKYTWHQPKDLISFSPVLTSNDTKELNPTLEKPIQMSKSKFSEAKYLIRYVLRN